MKNSFTEVVRRKFVIFLQKLIINKIEQCITKILLHCSIKKACSINFEIFTKNPHQKTLAFPNISKSYAHIIFGCFGKYLEYMKRAILWNNM